MPTPSTNPKTTIWIWPTGLFPRRILYYLRAQNITLSELLSQNIHLVPVVLDPIKNTLGVKEGKGYPALPEGMTVPCMYIAPSTSSSSEKEEEGGAREEDKGQWVRESISIISYLEEIFCNNGSDEGRASIYGTTTSQRLKTHDIVSTFSADIVPNYITELTHTVSATKLWSHMKDEEMSAGAGAHARRRKQFYLGRLEDWVRRDVVECGMRSLSGEGREVTLADVLVMAQVCYVQKYGWDVLEGCVVLKKWWAEAMKGEWWVGEEGLKGCEERGWKVVLGE
ncbi:hypothetical protein DM02DRAFT_686438 [Periconia macrospinosa]|uniref:GST N-terminal domain-containing protein n=1 Tax=Periconia macrospinosa TaxID=97972 RepID=A0A2V1E5Q7_9PLEO|nr:hypothetical protein DM02DRAFT_686438 [Periconia macrospinosa]